MGEFYFEAKGQKWFCSAINAGDLKRFAQWAQYKPYNDFKSQRANLDPEDYKEISKQLLNDCARNPYKVGSEAVKEAMNTPEGAAYLVYLSLVKTYPNITATEIEDMLGVEQLEEAMESVMLASGWMNDEEIKKKRMIANP